MRPRKIARELREVAERHAKGRPGSVAVGIDSPDRPMPRKRRWFWNRAHEEWRPRTTQKGWGRHSELVLAVLRLANPQWTPPPSKAPDWMKVGFAIFKELRGAYPHVHEVFPSASYSMLRDAPEVRLKIRFTDFVDGPKDMLDACVSAVTVREYVLGRGCAVGGGDGLGKIILPRPVPDHSVLRWPK